MSLTNTGSLYLHTKNSRVFKRNHVNIKFWRV